MPGGGNRKGSIKEAICRARGGRLTQQRRAVLAKLLAAECPVTAYELLDLLRPEDATASASTCRSLESLMDMGLVRRLDSTRSFVACGLRLTGMCGACQSDAAGWSRDAGPDLHGRAGIAAGQIA